jgi:hypothetical protein
MNILGRNESAILTNKSGGALDYGNVCIIDTANAAAVDTTTTVGYASGKICVCAEPAGVANDALGKFWTSGDIAQMNLSGTGNIGDLVRTHSVAGQGVRHAAPFLTGDFAIVLGTSATPRAILFSNPTLSTPPIQVDATDITGCILWYDLDQESFAEGDAIGTLNDFSSSANDATQSTGGLKPTARLNVANGKKGAFFDGGDYLILGTNVDLATNHTVIVVMSPGYFAAYSPVFQYKQQGIYQSINGTVYWGIYRSGDGVYGPVTGGKPQIIGLWGSSNSAYDMLHNRLKRVGTNINAFAAHANSYVGTDSLNIGVQCHAGYIFEIIVYDNKISESDLYALIDWLEYKWTGVIRG